MCGETRTCFRERGDLAVGMGAWPMCVEGSKYPSPTTMEVEEQGAEEESIPGDDAVCVVEAVSMYQSEPGS